MYKRQSFPRTWHSAFILIVSLGGFFASSVVSAQTMASSVSQHGITWYFDGDYEVGQFVNGDYWVVGPVVITEIDPAWRSGPYGSRNGTMINVVGNEQGLDAYRDPNYGAIRYNDDLNIESGSGLPVTVSGNNSVISAIGRSEEASNVRLRPSLQTMAVLTVLEAAPASASFRPSYVGTEKTIYEWSKVQENLWRLPDRESVQGTPTVSSFIGGLNKPWGLLSVPGWQGRYLHAIDNMPGYHREVGRRLGEAAVLLMMDVEGREELLKHFIQIGIDYYATGQNMIGTSAQWQWPVIFAGIMLGDDAMRDVYLTGDRHPGNDTREQRQLYRLPDENLSSVSSSIVPGGANMVTWTGKTAAWRQDTSPANCYHQEHLHPTEWNSVSSAQNCSQALATRESYRRINSPAYALMALAASSMAARDRFDRSDLYFDYAERWMEEDLSDPVHDIFQNPPAYTNDNREYGSTTSDFADAYYVKYGWNPADVIKGEDTRPRPPELFRAD